ncbi:MAG: sigma-70 family RNA polymerase sigma factor [Clostridia bacterium]|nr:sigma-70 family RNA polymerase sigma factor [Clostridia bacterium]
MDNGQIIEAFKKYKETGDVGLRNEIAEHYLYIAEILAKKFVNRGVEYDDLHQVASLALLKGIERFNPDMGMQFTTFITPTITGEIKNYFRDKSRSIKLPRRLAKLNADVRKKRDELLAETGKKPTSKELAEALGVTEEDVLRALEIGGVISLDGMANDEDNDKSLYDVLPSDENPFAAFEDSEALQNALADFSDTEKALLTLRYGEELSQAATAQKLGVSQMFVSRMERKLLKRLRDRLTQA